MEVEITLRFKNTEEPQMVYLYSEQETLVEMEEKMQGVLGGIKAAFTAGAHGGYIQLGSAIVQLSEVVFFDYNIT